MLPNNVAVSTKQPHLNVFPVHARHITSYVCVKLLMPHVFNSGVVLIVLRTHITCYMARMYKEHI